MGVWLLGFGILRRSTFCIAAVVYRLSADIAMDGVYEENAGAIFFLLFNHVNYC